MHQSKKDNTVTIKIDDSNFETVSITTKLAAVFYNKLKDLVSLAIESSEDPREYYETVLSVFIVLHTLTKHHLKEDTCVREQFNLWLDGMETLDDNTRMH